MRNARQREGAVCRREPWLAIYRLLKLGVFSWAAVAGLRRGSCVAGLRMGQATGPRLDQIPLDAGLPPMGWACFVLPGVLDLGNGPAWR